MRHNIIRPEHKRSESNIITILLLPYFQKKGILFLVILSKTTLKFYPLEYI